MYLLSNLNFNRKYLLSILLALFPICFVAGNMMININLVFIIILTIFFYHKDLFKTKLFFLDKLFILIFLLILVTGILNDLYFFKEKLSWKGYFSTTIKSIFFLKYLILYFVLRFLTENKIINLKFFFITCAASTLFVSLDIYYQFIFGKDIFGYETLVNSKKLGGPFGDELIAGSFIQRFSIFSFFILPFFYSNYSKKISKYLIPILFIVFFIGIILSGNRMPLLLFIFSIFLIIIFNPQTKKFFLPFLVIFLLLFTLIFNLNSKVKNNFESFYFQISNMVHIIATKDYKSDDAPQYFKEFETFYDTWLINKYFGGGVKNFRYYCHVRPNIKKDAKFICNMHPHNYYLEILTETGVVGLLIFICIFMNILYLTFIKKYLTKLKNDSDKFLIPFIFLFIVEIFPIKSTGSFFTTGNSTYLFLLIGLMIGLVRGNNLIENKI